MTTPASRFNVLDTSVDPYYMIPLEDPITTENRGTWEYCSIRWMYTGEVVTQRYRHVECDCMTDHDGNCKLCGAPSPSSLNWR